jgi:DNA-binding IclR family transcriptional regulator
MYRYIALLRRTGLLVGDDRGSYRLSARLLGLARAAAAAEALIGIADPYMRDLSAQTGETVILCRLIARKAMCVHRVESARDPCSSVEPGTALPLGRGASTRLLLASMAEPAREEYLAGLREEDPPTAERLAGQVRLAAQRGWATSEEEIDRGVWAASAAVTGRRGIVAALTVPSPLVRTPASLQVLLLSRVRATAAAVSEAFRASRGLIPT